jgi:hypothetical protein
MRDDPFRRHLDDYAAVGQDSAVPPMVHEIYRRGRRHQRIQVMTWSTVGVLTLVATFLAGMVVRDQTDPTVAGVAISTTSSPPTTAQFGAFPSTTAFPPTTVDPMFTTTSFDFTTTSFDFTTTTFSATTTTSGSSAGVPTLTGGKHASIIKSISGNSVTFDKVQFFRGSAATREAREDGKTTTNGWYMRNTNTGLRTLTANSNAKIQALRKTMGRTGSPNSLVTVTLSQLAAKVPTSPNSLFSITLSNGRIVSITEFNLS